MHKLIEQDYIPLDKSWIIRMGVLDLINHNDKTIKFLESQENLSDDLKSLLRVLKSWNNEKVDVGESGTLYRFLKFISWKLGLNKKFILNGTLKERNICDNEKIVGWSQKELLKLDNGTSQWASAAVLLGDKERLEDAPFKLRLTYEAVDNWCKDWEPRYDKTILKQVNTFIKLLKNKKNVGFILKQAESYCFARVFGFVNKEIGEKLFPNLKGHESNRLLEMEEQLKKDIVDSKDHRVVQAIAMFSKIKGKKIKFLYPECVSKSWSQFWKFLEASNL